MEIGTRPRDSEAPLAVIQWPIGRPMHGKMWDKPQTADRMQELARARDWEDSHPAQGIGPQEAREIWVPIGLREAPAAATASAIAASRPAQEVTVEERSMVPLMV
jgi:hypothetical protein